MKKNIGWLKLFGVALLSLSLVIPVSVPPVSRAAGETGAVSIAQVPENYYYSLIDDEDTRKVHDAYKSLINGSYITAGKRLEDFSESELKSLVTQGKAASFGLTDKSLTNDDLPVIVTTAFEAMNYDDPMDVKSQALSMSADAVIINGIIYLAYTNPPALDFDDMQRKADEAKTSIVNEIRNDPRYSEDPAVKELLVHDLLCASMKYDGAAAAGNGDRLYIGHTVYAAMVEGNAVCDAISMSCAAILKDLGVETYVVDGDSHAWNLIKLDDKYYELDCTWDMAQFDDDNKTSHKYFNRKTEYMTETDHTRELLSLKLPQADGDVYTFEKVMSDMGYVIGEYSTGNLNYELSERMEAVLKGASGSVKKLNIPDVLKVNGHDYKVIIIEDDAFKNSNVKNLTIGKNVQILGERAFAGCKKLKTVTIKSAKVLQYVLADSFKGAAKKITFKIKGGKKDFTELKQAFIDAGVKKGTFIRK